MLNGRVRNEVAEVGKREQENVIMDYLQLLFFLFSVKSTMTVAEETFAFALLLFLYFLLFPALFL